LINPNEQENKNPDEMILKDLIVTVLKTLPNHQGSANEILATMIKLFGANKVYSLGYHPIGIENQNEASEKILKQRIQKAIWSYKGNIFKFQPP
jgi:hypothetical protein